MYRVELEACVAGNPLKAWKVRLPDGEDSGYEPAPDREPPDDVWEAQSWPFDDLEAAKQFVRDLPEPTTTHVRIYGDGDELLFDQDAGAEHLDAAGPGVALPHLVDSKLPDEPEEVPEAPPLAARQEAGQ